MGNFCNRRNNSHLCNTSSESELVYPDISDTSRNVFGHFVPLNKKIKYKLYIFTKKHTKL